MDIMILQEYMALESNKPKRVQIKIGRRYRLASPSFCVWPRIIKKKIFMREKRVKELRKKLKEEYMTKSVENLLYLAKNYKQGFQTRIVH